ncbi:hypothetical protein LguiA_016837 [Lonicera macranthoides]
MKAFLKRRMNLINRLVDDDGRELVLLQDIGNEAIRYFSQLFQSIEPSMEAMDAVTKWVEMRITSSINDMLTIDFSASKVLSALKFMSPSKAPGPDGMPSLFFQKY